MPNVTSREGAVVAVADGAVRFPDYERSGLRDALRAAVSEPPVADGQVLRRTFVGSLPQGAKTDVENRVLLNTGVSERCLRHATVAQQDQSDRRG
jgi:hypothetical protein